MLLARKKGIMTLVKSMTGYGRAVETVNGREFTVELRSVTTVIWIAP